MERPMSRIRAGRPLFVGIAALALLAAGGAGRTRARAPDPDTGKKIKALLEERRDILRAAWKNRQEAFRAGRLGSVELARDSELLLEAELELAATPAERVT